MKGDQKEDESEGWPCDDPEEDEIEVVCVSWGRWGVEGWGALRRLWNGKWGQETNDIGGMHEGILLEENEMLGEVYNEADSAMQKWF